MARCEHLESAPAQAPQATTPDGCEECLAAGGRWVHLRLCLTCGHVGCCDSSPGKHATRPPRGDRAPRDRLVRAGGDLALVLRGRGRRRPGRPRRARGR